jgi:hypothetical protein
MISASLVLWGTPLLAEKIKAAARGALKHMMRRREGSTSFMANGER